MLAVAHAEGDVAGISDELFKVGRAVDNNDELRTAISDARIPAERRIQIMDDLLDGKARQATKGLVSMVVGAGRGADLGKIASALADKAATSQGKQVATVRSAVALSDDQLSRLGAALAAKLGTEVDVKVIQDPSVVGGLITTVGDTVIDGSLMSDLTIDTSAITAALTKNLDGFEPSLEASQVGHIVEVGDGIARVSGLPNAAVNEMLEFENGSIGLALNLDEDTIGAVVLGEVDEIAEGQTVRSTGDILSMPVGDALLGRVVNAIGEPIDGKGPLVGAKSRRMEVQAPGIMGRKPVHEPMQTGIKAIDSLIPIGRGQRELIIGDRKTGKTTIALDTIINQRGLGVKCIYVAVGQKASTVAQAVATLEEIGAMEYTVVVVAPASDPAPFKYLAPYAGSAIGPAVDGRRRSRTRGLRRSVEAGRGLPSDVTAAASPAWPRGLPRRRLLPAQPPSRTCRQAER
ncbi:ATP synthase subunit alpha [Nymphon striatum]|nr:ATP synthase subunit alpha [Nymphon striatum]